jgi:spermidine synthase/MFS family permease
MEQRHRWLSCGLFLTTFATLLIELLDSRLLSVLTWYHLSFLAVSLAMLGMAAGAVLVFLGGERSRGERARRLLGRLAYAFAVAIPATHFLLLRTRIPPLNEFSMGEILPLGLATVLLTVPFLLSGATVTIALTRVGGRIGVLYGADLIGASAGCLAIVPLLDLSDVMSTALVASGLAAAGAWCFQRSCGTGRAFVPAITAATLGLGALAHVWAGSPIDVMYPRGNPLLRKLVDLSIWNAYSHVTVLQPHRGAPFFWGRGKSPKTLAANTAIMLIDGEAGTPLTEWNGDPNSVFWVQYDVTALAYHLRSGDVGVIGVGGGRDVLAAIWGRSTSIIAIELNKAFVDILLDSHRDFAKLADWDRMRLINEGARSYLTRFQRRFDILQMSLIDTWAATGAGAFTLSENALYTIEAWQVFLSRLKPTGIFSTSRWFAPENVSETSRLLSLCVAALMDLGIENPADHIALVSRGLVATLLTSPSPFSERDIAKLRELAQRYEFNILAVPGTPPADPRLAQIVSSSSARSLLDATADPHYDYTAPTDRRPYFFNMLKPGALYGLLTGSEGPVLGQAMGVVRGNLRATVTLGVLLVIATGLVIGIILLPLAWVGLPRMRGRTFAASLAYFAMIGYGFMSIQIPFLQRFSVFIGHPIYTYSVILFTMILFAGIGSLLSDRLRLEGRRWHIEIPLVIATLLLALTLLLQAVLDATISMGLIARCLVVVALTAPLSLLLGCCFPIGMRLVSEISEDAAAWMWGINGACGVLASILAVAVSMWVGIYANLVVATALYAGLTIPARALAREVLPAAAAREGDRT